MGQRRWVRRLAVTLGVLVGLAIVVRLLLDPIAAHYTRQALNKSEHMKGTFSGVHVSLLPPGYEINRLKMIEMPGGDWKEPLLYVEHTRMSIMWHELLHRHLVARVDIHKPKFLAITRPEEKAKKAKQATPELSQMLEEQLPFKIDRITVTDGEVLLAQREAQGDDKAALWLNRIELVAANLATRKALMQGEPSTLRLDARVQRTGKLAIDATMNPLAKALTFSLKAALRDLELRELYGVVAPATKMAADRGTIDLFGEMRARDGALTGGVKPVLTDVELKSVERGLGARIKAALADVSLDILEDERGEHGVAATTIPIKGSLVDPHLQLLPAVLGAVRNAFVVGLSSGFTNLPPPTAAKKEGALKQAWHALKKDEGPPKAEPEASDGKKPAEPRQGRAGQPRSRQQK
jgi:hypothetical protein